MDNIIEIFSGTPWECEMIKSLLKDAEIESFLKNNVLSSYAFEPSHSGGVQVMISGSDVEGASAVVDEFYKNMKSNTR